MLYVLTLNQYYVNYIIMTINLPSYSIKVNTTFIITHMLILDLAKCV